MGIVVRNAYRFASTEKGERDFVYLVSYSWPRAIRKEDIGVDEWLKALMPSRHIMEFMNSDNEWTAFLDAYSAELADHWASLRSILEKAANGQVFLLHASRENYYNPAHALKAVLEHYL